MLRWQIFIHFNVRSDIHKTFLMLRSSRLHSFFSIHSFPNSFDKIFFFSEKSIICLCMIGIISRSLKHMSVECRVSSVGPTIVLTLLKWIVWFIAKSHYFSSKQVNQRWLLHWPLTMQRRSDKIDPLFFHCSRFETMIRYDISTVEWNSHAVMLIVRRQLVPFASANR